VFICVYLWLHFGFMSDLKQIARKIFAETLAAIDIPATMQRKLARTGTRISCEDTEIELAGFNRILAVVIGKAGNAMAAGLCEVLAPEYSVSGILAVPAAPERELPGFRTFLAGHPVPNAASLEAGRAALDLLRGADERTLIFFLLSGGGSALCEAPLDPAISLQDIQQLNRALVTCGAPIDDINAVRKHLSAIKGGRLAAAAPQATKITLGVTDVPAGRESALASGPTLPDPTTVSDVLRVVKEYELLAKLPPSICAKLESTKAITETPKAGDAAFARAHFSLLLGMPDLFHHAHRAAEAQGCVTICDNSTDDWPLVRAADALLAGLAELKRKNPSRPTCMIADGEVSSPVTGHGIGGRNAAFVLDCVEKIPEKRIAVLSAGTDGVDGNSPAAGAVADGETLSRAREAGLGPADYFRRSDAYTFFKKLDDTVETGPTGNNLRDLRILLHE
jgi:hydroxypyruvate reductase